MASPALDAFNARVDASALGAAAAVTGHANRYRLPSLPTRGIITR